MNKAASGDIECAAAIDLEPSGVDREGRADADHIDRRSRIVFNNAESRVAAVLDRKRFAAARMKLPFKSHVSWPLSVMLPFALNVPPNPIVTVPVAFTVVVPVPLLKVPPASTFRLAALALAAPIVAVDAPRSVTFEPVPLIVRLPVLVFRKLAMVRFVPVTVAPPWMVSVPLVPSWRSRPR